MINVAHHVYVGYHDLLELPDANERAAWYGVTGVPDVRIDGKYSVIGASSCASAYDQYRQRVLQRQTETAGLSPIEITGRYAVASGMVSMEATCRLIDPAALSDLVVTFVVYEDSIHAAGPDYYAELWSHVTRAIRSESIELSNPGDEAMVSAQASIATSCRPEQVHVVAFVQCTTGSKEIIQAAFLDEAYRLMLAPAFRSIPAGNGAAVFLATLIHGRGEPSSYTIFPSPPGGSEPSFGDWAVSLTGCGSLEYQPDPVTCELGPGEACSFTVRVETNDAPEIRSGSIEVASGRLAVRGGMRVFNGPAVLVVDYGSYATMIGELEDLGALFDHWPEPGIPPQSADLAGYDILAWDGGLWGPSQSAMIADSTIANFVDGGGSVFLASQSYLNQHAPGDFLARCFGVATFLLDQGYVLVDGVPQDPIGDGLHLPLQFQYPHWSRGELLTPAIGAEPVLSAGPDSPAALRYTTSSGARSVLMAFPFSSIRDTDPDPNNRRVVLGRVLAWLAGAEVSEAEEGLAGGATSALRSPRPNPFTGRIDLPFRISARAAGAPARLEVFDPAGRRVASIYEGRPAAGERVVPWDGHTDQGRPSPAGVYFVRLTTLDGVEARKVTLLRE